MRFPSATAGVSVRLPFLNVQAGTQAAADLNRSQGLSLPTFRLPWFGSLGGFGVTTNRAAADALEPLHRVRRQAQQYDPSRPLSSVKVRLPFLSFIINKWPAEQQSAITNALAQAGLIEFLPNGAAGAAANAAAAIRPQVGPGQLPGGGVAGQVPQAGGFVPQGMPNGQFPQVGTNAAFPQVNAALPQIG